MSQKTYNEVQAALLNSEQAPLFETMSALRAVASFADNETDVTTKKKWLNYAEQAWEQYERSR